MRGRGGPARPAGDAGELPPRHHQEALEAVAPWPKMHVELSSAVWSGSRVEDVVAYMSGLCAVFFSFYRKIEVFFSLYEVVRPYTT